jgi:hypothetical protein
MARMHTATNAINILILFITLYLQSKITPVFKESYLASIPVFRTI